MFTSFSLMLQQIFSMFTKLASAGEKAASALDHLGGWTDDTAAAFADQARVEREQKLAILNHNMAQRKLALARTVGEVSLDSTPAPAAPQPEAVPA
jgi:hypothetical protein